MAAEWFVAETGTLASRDTQQTLAALHPQQAHDAAAQDRLIVLCGWF